MKGLLLIAAVVAAPALARADRAEPPARTGPPVGLAEAFRFTPTAGFVDDPVASDGKRVAFVVADTAGTAQLHVADLDGKELAAPIDLATVTVKPTALAWIGDRVLVIGGDDGAVLAALIDLKGKVVYRTPTADHATLVTRDGKQLVALYRIAPIKTGTRYTVELRAVETGKKVGKVKPLDLDGGDKNAKLDFRVNHWVAGWTRAVGIKGGTWNKAEDQQSPDVEATYDLASGKFIATAAITDLLAQHKRFAVLKDADGKDAFARVAQDLSAIELWQDGQPTTLTLDQPIMLYGDPRKSLDFVAGPTGPWIALQVDPVNVEAVKRQKADIEYWDLFEVKGSAATRRGRLFAGKQRLRFGWAGDRLWVLERNVGFDRGGKALVIYKLTP